MADRPIIFFAPMIRALIDGRKTQTRRVLQEQPPNGAPFAAFDIGKSGAFARFSVDLGGGNFDLSASKLRYWIGDRLWVREACSFPQSWVDSPSRVHIGQVFYPSSADVSAPSPWPRHDGPDHGKLRSPIHMPRWASRLTLTVTDVRVQRLQDISEADAVAEGVTRCEWAEAMADDGRREFQLPEFKAGEYPGLTNAHPTAWGAYMELWNTIHGPDAWDLNPWIVALTFDVVRGNIDEVQP